MAATKTLSEEFREIRRVSTPIVVIQTTDYRVTARELMKVRVNGEDPPPVAMWTCVDGPVSMQGDVSIGSNEDAPYMVLTKALQGLQNDGILFWVMPDDFATPNHSWTNAFTIQAVANLRDEFKTNRRTLVILSIDGKLPSLFADDVPLLKDPLPDEKALVDLTSGLLATVNQSLKDARKNPVKVSDEDVVRGAKLCRGMNRFAAEEAVSRNLSKNGLDLDNLATSQRLVIEQSSERVLTFERGTETFDDIGGLDQIKKFSKRLFSGEPPPSVIVRIEEIEKAMAGSGSGFGDSTGVSQDQLGVLLTCMEDYEWSGLVAVGPAGSGKSLISKAMGNSNKALTLNLNLGAAKGQYVGQSEGKIRKAMNILRGVAGSGAFFIATSNGLNVIPPELRRRFKFGVWAFDLPLPEERKMIWNINLKRFNLDTDQERPDDTDWVGSDIRNVCDLAQRLRCPLVEAAEFIVPVAKSAPEAVQKLREAAHQKFLSASEPGAYKKPEANKGRKISV